MNRFRLFVLGLTALALAAPLRGEVKLPAVFSDHMVLQRDMETSVWGWAEAGEAVTVSIAEQAAKAKAGADGAWRVKLKALPAGGPHTLTVKGSNTVTIQDVLVGEVWICSGQSNMAMTVGASKENVMETLTANHPRIRMITVPRIGTQEPQRDFKGEWQLCSPETVKSFSAAGYFFGRDIHQTLGVPVGLINDSYGGSRCEAWVRRDLLEADAKYKDLMDSWVETEKAFDPEKLKAKYDQQVEQWKERAAAAKAAGKPAPPRPRAPRSPLTGNGRPANLYNGMLKPVIGYTLRGAIWYQGESNASRGYQYRKLFPLMIKNWRDEWGIGEFSFYWVQLADFKAEVDAPQDSEWAELREAQTLTLDALPNTGEAVIIDIGEGADIHPKNKQDVGRRLARIALAKNYGQQVAYQSPRFESLAVADGKAVVTLKDVNGSLRAVDVGEVRGFAIAGEDKKFVAAEAKLLPKGQVEVWSKDVPKPVAVRYAWADNPVCNLYDTSGLPVTPFRSDDWPGVTAENTK